MCWKIDIPETGVEQIAFETSMDVPNMLGNPVPLRKKQILELLEAFY